MTGGVLVTGGAGFIGSHLVDLLAAAGERVTVLDNLATGSRENLADAPQGAVRLVVGSVLDDDAIAAAIEGCDRVYHLAVECVRRSLGQPRHNHEVNATGTLAVLEVARQRGVRRFVYCSSSEVYGNASRGLLHEDDTPCRPTTVYGAAKLAGELYTEAYHQTYGLPVTIVRPFNAYGPRAHLQGDLAEVVPRFLIRVLNGLPPIVFGDGSQGRDFTHVSDVAHGLAAAGASDALIGRRVNIAYGKMLSVNEVAEAVMRVCGRNDLMTEKAEARPGDVEALRADTRRAADLLGYTARLGFEDGLRRYVEWFRARYPDPPSSLLEPVAENWQLLPRQPAANTPGPA